MIHRSTPSRAPSRPGPAGRGIPRVRQWAIGLAVAAIAFLAGAPAALAVPLPPPGGATGTPVTPPPPPTTAAAHLPLWTVVAIMTATAVLSVATTLITLSLEHRHRTRRTPPAQARPPVGVQPVSTTAEPPAGQEDILSSHQHLASYDIRRSDSR